MKLVVIIYDFRKFRMMNMVLFSGFTTYNDVTYPFVTQAILTNGKLFSFYQYQLNTIVLHTDKNESNNPLYNECHATPPMELYHEVDHDGVKGISWT